MAEHARRFARVTVPFRNLSHRVVHAGLIAAAFVLVLLGKADALLVERLRAQVTDAVAPILDAASRPAATLANWVERGRGYALIAAENARLRDEQVRLLHWQEAARRLEAENRELRGLLRFVPGPELGYVTARVIADTGGAFAHTLVVGGGARDGLRKGTAVVTGEGLVGRVVSVGQRSARILLITDLNSRVPVLVGTGGVRAILSGDNTDQAKLTHIQAGQRIAPGDRVVTSGHGGVFPPRLAVGVVASAAEGSVRVQPFVARERLEYVRIVDTGLLDPQPVPVVGSP